jgi:uncharacterized protein (TIGR00730 family)
MRETICVYCASSQRCDAVYHDAARRMGDVLAANGFTVVYGGGGRGSMGALADGALARGGKVIGVMPQFMHALEWGHPQLTELRIVEDMRTRKHQMLSQSQGLVVLPGGCGTFEELFEALTLKRLGLYVHPIVLVNTRNYFAPLVAMLDHMVAEQFMGPRHGEMWQIVADPDDVPRAFETAPPWSDTAREFAQLK